MLSDDQKARVHPRTILPGCTDSKATKTSVRDCTSTDLALAGEATAEAGGVARGDAVWEGGAFKPAANGGAALGADEVSGIRGAGLAEAWPLVSVGLVI